MKTFTKTLAFAFLISPITSFALTTPEHASSIKLNDIELIEAVPANQLEKITGKLINKVKKEYSECSTNYEYSTTLTNGNFIKFEIYAEDNPQIKSDAFYKSKNNFQQLSTTKGKVWLTWKVAPTSNDRILINNKVINNQYNLTQFKKDFPKSAKQGTTVVMLSPTELKQYLKSPADFDLDTFAHLTFNFKNGVLNTLEIDQGMAC